MDKKTVHKKWSFRLLQVLFLFAFMFFIILGIWGIFYEDDMPVVAFFYASVVGIVYLFVKKVLYHYHLQFAESK